MRLFIDTRSYVNISEIGEKAVDEALQLRKEDFLTSSTCHPKFIREQWSDTLMPFHKHSPVDGLLALRGTIKYFV